MKDEYFLEDTDQVTKKSFLEWIERPNKNLQATKLLKEFERYFFWLSKLKKLTLEPNKVELFFQASNKKLQEKLEVLLEDKEEEEGLTTKWRVVEDAFELLAKKERRKDRFGTWRVVQVPKISMPTTRLTMPIVQPPLITPKKEDMGPEEIVRRIRDL